MRVGGHGMDDLLSEFLTETSENLATLDLELVKLEQNPNDPGLVGSIFRIVHTIKGTCGFLGLPGLEHVAHASENVLGRIRSGDMKPTPGVVSLILESLDTIKGILAVLEATEAEPPGEDAALIGRLNAVAEGGPEALEGAAPAAAPSTAGSSDAAALEALFAATPGPAPVAAPPAATPAAPATPAVAATPATPVAPAPAEAKGTEVARVEPASPPAEAPAPAAPAEAPAAAPAPAADSAVANQTIRVSVDLLENLMTRSCAARKTANSRCRCSASATSPRSCRKAS